MMQIEVVTLFPEMFRAITTCGITARAVAEGIIKLAFWNPRDFATDKYKTVDDKPYGGGPGMLMKVAPLKATIASARQSTQPGCQVIYLSPQGKRLEQSDIVHLAQHEQLILVAGRYEGIDERLFTTDIDAEYSIGDYVVSGGELPAMVLIDSMTRLQAGAVGTPASVLQDSFSKGLLDHPHYTRPETVDGMGVPAVLLSGDHAAIERWRLQQALGRTCERRPDLLAKLDLTALEQQLLAEYQAVLEC